MPIRTAPRFCLGGRVVGLKSYRTVVEFHRDCMCGGLGLFLTQKQCVVETGQMSAVETGQMSAAETGQMSFVARADICLVSAHPMLKSQKSQLWQCHSVQVRDQLWQCHNVQVSEVSIVQVADRRSGPKSAKMVRNGSRMVARY